MLQSLFYRVQDQCKSSYIILSMRYISRVIWAEPGAFNFPCWPTIKRVRLHVAIRIMTTRLGSTTTLTMWVIRTLIRDLAVIQYKLLRTIYLLSYVSIFKLRTDNDIFYISETAFIYIVYLPEKLVKTCTLFFL